ncbi:hypothetical protein D9M71_775550 [compost metagenome]
MGNHDAFLWAAAAALRQELGATGSGKNTCAVRKEKYRHETSLRRAGAYLRNGSFSRRELGTGDSGQFRARGNRSVLQ